MEIEKLIDSLKKCANHHMCVDCLFASDNGNCIDAIMRNAATALEQVQSENDRLKEIISCYCDMCIEQDGVMWCQSCDEKCDYCIHPKEASHD